VAGQSHDSIDLRQRDDLTGKKPSRSRAAAKHDIGTLISVVAWQDSLLQSYRGLYYMLEVAMLGALVSLLVFRAQVGPDYQGSFVDIATIIGLFFIRSYFAERTRRAVKARCDDVDYWQRQALVAEREMPVAARELSKFKAWQKEHTIPYDPEMSPHELLGQAPGISRRTFNRQLPLAFLAMWISMVALLVLPSLRALF